MQRLNVLWIVTTQWRAQACGYAGDVNARTPTLNRLAAESVNFAEAVTPHPFGPFARAALLTGIPSPQNGLRDYFDPLPLGARTIAHEMGERGYATVFFGKWHLAQRDPAAPLVGEAHARIVVPPEARGGFEMWEGFESGFLLNDPWLHGSRLQVPTRFTGYQADIVCERFVEWFTENSSSRPSFALVSLEAPHPPYDAPASGIPSLNPTAVQLAANVPRGGEVEARARRELAGYYAHIEAVDRALARVIDAVAENTIVVFTSVHGDMHGAHGLFRKGWPHEESVRVPLLVRIPGNAPRLDRSAVSLLDLARLTVISLEDRRGPAGGAPFARISMPSVVNLPWQCDRAWRGIRSSRRKLVLDATGVPWIFYDLERDPLEQHNLVAERSRASELAELVTAATS